MALIDIQVFERESKVGTYLGVAVGAPARLAEAPVGYY